MSLFEHNDEPDYSNEIKACNISKPQDALKSDFAKKLYNNFFKKNKYKEWYINSIIVKLTEDEIDFTEKERDDLLLLIDEYQENFDLLVKRYK